MITKRQYEKIVKAKDLLGLGESATLAEIKLAYRLYAKRHHPDLAGDNGGSSGELQMVTEGYQALMAYCAQYKFPLVLDSSELELDAEDWWLNRFGQDPLWGKQKV